MEPQTVERTLSNLKEYKNWRQYLNEPAPISPYLKAVLLLLETPYLPSHISSIIQPEFSPKDHQSIKLSSRKDYENVGDLKASDNYVYIIPHAYLSKWLNWANHQLVPDHEKDRLNLAISIAAAIYEIDIPSLKPMSHVSSISSTETPRSVSSVDGNRKQSKAKPAGKKSKKGKLTSLHSHQDGTTTQHNQGHEGFLFMAKEQSLSNDSPYPDPGPVDATSLSVPDKPFLLHPHVMLHKKYNTSIGSSLNPYHEADLTDHLHQYYYVSAVPELFYEYICTTHGVICQDKTSIHFHPPSIHSNIQSAPVLYHIQYGSYPHEVECKTLHELTRSLDRFDLNMDDKQPFFNAPSCPVEFRRKVLTTIIKEGPSIKEDSETEIELFPYQFYYRMVYESISKDNIEKYNIWREDKSIGVYHGCVLISRSCDIQNAFGAFFKCVVPLDVVRANCVRLWYDRRATTNRQNEKRGTTFIGDGFELVDLFDIELNHADIEHRVFSVEEWMKLKIGSTFNQINLLVEIRTSPEYPWPRTLLEHSNRVQVGDFVDAQNLNGQWYEAVVREVSDSTVRVHFCGWSSKRDHTFQRFEVVECITPCSKLKNPLAPLWTKTTRWRDLLCVGDFIEVRSSTSTAENPEWFPGVVKHVGCDHDPMQPTNGGADLEIFDNKGVKHPLLLLQRKRQILVLVEREPILETTGQNEVATCIDSAEVPRSSPPRLRWVNLYGEEICKWGTHLHPKPDGDFDHNKDHNIIEPFSSKVLTHRTSVSAGNLLGTPLANGSVGLFNLGNTCYMNAILQCLNQIEVLTSYFLKEQHLKDLNESNPLGTGGELAVAYGTLLRKIWTGKYSSLSPEDFKLTFAKFAPQFNNTYQHDSHEFCSFLLDGLHEDMNRVKDKPYIEDVEALGMDSDTAAMSSWRNYLKRHDSFFVDHCHGLQKSHLTCPHCGKQSMKFDVYSSLSLTLDKSQQNTLINCLDKFTQGEDLDEANGWYCSQCQNHVRARKKIQLWTTPDILILHLKRFTFTANGAKKHGLARSKIQDVISFPIDRLDLHKYVYGPKDDGAPPVYKLIGVAEHSGMTTNSGHYTATVRSIKNGVWYHYNDNHISITKAEAAISKGAYILFYERSFGTSRWAGMEKLLESINKPSIDVDGFTVVSKKKKKK